MNLKKFLAKLQGELKDTERSHYFEWAVGFNSGLTYAMKTAEQLEELDETKMNLKELEQANLLLKNIKNLELLAKSEIQSINVKYPDKINDRVYLSEKLENVIKKAVQDYADEIKEELKDLGVDYE